MFIFINKKKYCNSSVESIFLPRREREGGRMEKEGAGRSLEQRDNRLYNALKSIYEDSLFVDEICQLCPQLPLVANLRCSLWYSPNFHSTSYFKYLSPQPPSRPPCRYVCMYVCTNLFNKDDIFIRFFNWAGQRGGCVIVDSTRREQRFPDSLSKAIPIWICVLNRAIAHFRKDSNIDATSLNVQHVRMLLCLLFLYS